MATPLGLYEDPQTTTDLENQMEVGHAVYQTNSQIQNYLKAQRDAANTDEASQFRQQLRYGLLQSVLNQQDTQDTLNQFHAAATAPLRVQAAINGTHTQDTVRQSTQRAVAAGADPDFLKAAKAHLGEANYIQWCEKFVDDMQGVSDRSGRGTAYSAWQNFGDQAVADPSLKGARAGDRVYFGPARENGGAGHVGFLDHDGNVVSADNNGIESRPTDYFNAPVLGYVPSASNPTGTPPQQQGPGTMADITDTSALTTALGEPSGAPQADTGEHFADATAGVQPVAQYNQEAPGGLGTFQQVTKNASGNFDTQLAAQPSADQQMVYDAQNAATHGFTTPDVGAPLLASGQSAEPAPTPGTAAPASSASLLNPGSTDLAGPESPLSGMPGQTALPGSAGQTASNPSPQDTPPSNDLPGLFRQFADFIDRKASGLVNAAVNNPTAQAAVASSQKPAGEQDLGDVRNVMAAGMQPIGAAASQINPKTLGTEAANALMEATGGTPKEMPSIPVLSGAADIAASMTGPGGVLAKATEAPVAAKAVTEAAPTVLEAASKVIDNAMPAMGGGAAAEMPQQIADLNGLLGNMGKAIAKSASLPEALRSVAQADNAGDAIAYGLNKAYQAYGLTPSEGQAVADVLEGVPHSITGAISQKAIDVADALKKTNDATWEMANKAGVLDSMTENYFTHLVRVPAEEATGGGGITPAVLSDWSRFAMGRARDAEGNVLNPTVRDLKDYLAEAHPDWQVVEDVPTVVAAHVQSLAQAANHAALADYLKSALDSASGESLLSAVKRKGDVELTNVPNSLSKWLYKGTTPEEGNVLVGGKGVIGGAVEGAPVLVKQPLRYATRDAANLINQYMGADLLSDAIAGGKIPEGLLKVGHVYDTINRKIVGNKLLNILIHSENGWSEGLKQYGLDVPGFASDIAEARRILSDPVQTAKLLQDMPLNLSSVRKFTSELSKAAGRIQPEARSIPALSGLGDAWGATAGKLWDAQRQLLFEGEIQHMQVASALRAVREGESPVVAAKYANAKYGQFAPEDFNALARWVNQHMAFAGHWFAGNLIEYGSILGKSGYGGYAKFLSPEEQAALAGRLRGDFMRGAGTLAASHAILNKALSDKWPWENDPGHYVDINLGNGKYLGTPEFKREQDLVKFLTSPIPGGTSRTPGGFSGPIMQVGNKAAPLLGTARNIAANEQYPGGPPIIKANEDYLPQLAAFLENTALPGRYTPGNNLLPDNPADSGTGVVGAAANVREVSGQQKSSGGSRSGKPEQPHGAPHREKGGPVKEGDTYVVGEKGPELFVPSEGGEIVPNKGPKRRYTIERDARGRITGVVAE